MGAFKNFKPVRLTFPSSIASEAEEASFFAMWRCIKKARRMTLAAQLGMLARRGMDLQERNDMLSIIDQIPHIPNQTECETDAFAAFMTVLRDLTVPGMRSKQELADTNLLDKAPADSSSIGSNSSTEWSAQTSHGNSSFTTDTDSNTSTEWSAETFHGNSSFTTDTETYAVMQRQVVEEGPGMEGTASALTDTTASSTTESVSGESEGPVHDSSS
ncbi:hypothetical protein MHU86_6225 [Fragilaria crotonensis]|nr:hypothetical protein MHU86_6225 [Fragilaria crotonensis]